MAIALPTKIVPNNKVLVWGIDLINNPITNTIVE